jgi:alanyl-tRNA synthetase
MTDRLYYTQPHLREFDGVVTRVDTRDGRTHVTLDRTAFYPTSGGQPFDLGTLGSFPLVDVFDDEDGTIVHVVDLSGTRARADAPPAVGDTVHGRIDWPRRLDHMQQHTGQHVLSAAFERVAHGRTVSFHLGAESATIDLAREVSPMEIAAAEDEANRIVWEDRPVSIRFVTAEEAASLPLRKEPARSGTLRLVDVEEFDLSACGGTHVARTGSIGVIAVASWERFKGGQRIEFVCGGRALRRFGTMRDITAATGRLLSVGAGELAATIERMQAEAKEQKRSLGVMQTELARYRAEELAAGAETIELKAPAGAAAGVPGRAVFRAIDADANGLKTLASAITAQPGFLVVLTSTAVPAVVIVARSQDVAVQANQVLTVLTARFGGRGGGKPDMAQGGGLNAPSDEILATARATVS